MEMSGDVRAKICPYCHANSYVINSRTNDNGVIFRRRRCENCRETWSTVEIVIEEAWADARDWR